MAQPLSTSEKRFWRLVAVVQELCHVTDEEMENSPDISNHMKMVANLILFYQRNGTMKIKEATNRKTLEALGIAVLTPKKRK